MKTLPDPQLLRDYAERRSEAAFEELVRRHIDLVHSVAVRTVQDPHLAKDVIQGVFIALAKDAVRLAKHPTLVGWLHLTARNIAAPAVRSDRRRQAREQEAVSMNPVEASGPGWEVIGPQLDAVIGELAEADREAVLLRYFERKPAAEIASILGISAEAAQKRVNRAVERMRTLFAKRGITAAAGGLAGIIAAHAVQVAPLGWATLVAEDALKAAAQFLPAASTGAVAITAAQKSAIAASIALIAGATLYLSFHKPEAAPANGAGSSSVAAAPAKHRPPPSGTRPAATGRAGIKRDPARQASLDSLKRRWMEVNDNAHIAEQNALAKESVHLLLCGIELYDLAEFLDSNDAGYGLAKVKEELGRLFLSDRGPQARELLSQLSAMPVGQGQDSQLEIWCYIAGQNCPEGEFTAFRNSLKDQRLVEQAFLGRCLEWGKKDPEGTLAIVLEIQQSGLHTMNKSDFLSSLFGDELPEGTDFAKLESMLPIGGGDRESIDREPVDNARQKLFGVWGRRDSDAATEYILAHPDRCFPGLLGWVGAAIAAGKEESALAWPDRFPPGPYFDAAAAAVASHLSWNATDEARELAARIGDQGRRQKVLEKIELSRKLKNGEIEEGG